MNKDNLLSKLREIATAASALGRRHITTEFDVDYVTIFSHTTEEFDTLVALADQLAKQVDEHNGPVFSLTEPVAWGDHNYLRFFRVRTPDLERPQIGCADLVVSDFTAFKQEYLSVPSPTFRLEVRPDFEMIEIIEPVSNYLVYVPSEAHSDYMNRKNNV